MRNVSSYPDIADLYLIADVLITDYSSVMFDYVNTGRPMLFFTGPRRLPRPGAGSLLRPDRGPAGTDLPDIVRSCPRSTR